MTAPPADAAPQRFLSDVIIARRLVEPTAMRAALQASLAGRSLTEILVGNGSLSEDDLARTLAEHHRLDHIDLELFAVDGRATMLIEPDVARRLGAVPIAFLPDGAVVVALYDPNGSTAVLEFSRLTNRPIQPAVASRTQIEALIDSLRRSRRSLDFASPGAASAPPAPPPAAPPAAVAAAPPAAVAPPAEHLTLAFGEAGGNARAQTAEARRREAEGRAVAAEERAQAAEELALAAEARAAMAVGAANDALARLLKACDALEQRAGQVDALASRVDQLERAAVAPAAGRAPEQVRQQHPTSEDVEPSRAPAAPPATEAVREAAPAPAPRPSGHPGQRQREAAGGLRRLVAHAGGR